MQTENIDVGEAQAHLREILDRVNAGVQIILSENERPVARLVSVSQRIAGLHTGSISTSKDFSDPLPDEFWMGRNKWNFSIKSQLGKVRLRLPLAELVKSQQEANNLSILPINPSHVYALDELKPFHKDPFDRMLIAQSKVENLRLISNDEIVKKYPIEVEW